MLQGDNEATTSIETVFAKPIVLNGLCCKLSHYGIIKSFFQYKNMYKTMKLLREPKGKLT